MLKRYLNSYRSNIILFIINIPVIVLIVLLYPFFRYVLEKYNLELYLLLYCNLKSIYVKYKKKNCKKKK